LRALGVPELRDAIGRAQNSTKSFREEETAMQKHRRWTQRIGTLIAGLSLAATGTSATWGVDGALGRTGVIVGQVTEGPTTPVCRPNIPCTRPFANANIEVLDSATRNLVARAVTNRRGNFRVAVPPGTYLVHVQVIDFPRCPEATAAVRPLRLTRIRIACDTRIR
jgi:hypothetical protein